ncbi:hypothetical protein ABIA14_004719 [Sinorhizobium fredii]
MSKDLAGEEERRPRRRGELRSRLAQERVKLLDAVIPHGELRIDRVVDQQRSVKARCLERGAAL